MNRALIADDGIELPLQEGASGTINNVSFFLVQLAKASSTEARTECEFIWQYDVRRHGKSHRDNIFIR